MTLIMTVHHNIDHHSKMQDFTYLFRCTVAFSVCAKCLFPGNMYAGFGTYGMLQTLFVFSCVETLCFTIFSYQGFTAPSSVKSQYCSNLIPPILINKLLGTNKQPKIKYYEIIISNK